MHSQKFESALKRFDTFAQADPTSNWLAYPAYALAHQRMGNAQEADRWFKKAVEKRQELRQSLANDPTGMSVNANWPDFEILFGEASKALGKNVPK
jgi:tetratricopeptide (TPR) repeat protein